MDLGLNQILTREQLKNVMGADGSDSGTRCSDGRRCGIYMAGDGGCATMQTGQCRCVIYVDGIAKESVPSSYCLL